ncbi:MAG: HEAT repeat domain-containing protein [Treponema sp.]|nr:HEAT repeat domain-containing protein [Treponema sp.]
MKTMFSSTVFFRATMLAMVFLLAVLPNLHAQERAEQEDLDALRRDIVRFGTETEIAALMQELRDEGTDALDNEIIALTRHTNNHNILTVAFNFFGERERTGLEERAIYAVEERFDEHSETVLAAIDYLGRIGATDGLLVLREVAASEERRFLNNTIRALGRIGGAAGGEIADDMAEYLVEFYEDRDLESGTQREIILALGANGSSVAVAFLSDIVGNSDSGQFLRIAALESISRIGDPDGLDAVLANISAGEPHVRAAAVEALGPFSGAAVDAAILDAFRDSHERTRISAAHASRDRQLVAAIPYLRFRATRDASQAVREHSIRALGAIGNNESIQIIEELFVERRNAARVRTVAGEMLMQNEPDRFLDTFIEEMDEARRRNLTALYNSFLRILSRTTANNMEPITRRLMAERGIVERSYALEIAANNNLISLADEIRIISEDNNQALARRARRTLERLGLQ